MHYACRVERKRSTGFGTSQRALPPWYAHRRHPHQAHWTTLGPPKPATRGPLQVRELKKKGSDDPSCYTLRDLCTEVVGREAEVASIVDALNDRHARVVQVKVRTEPSTHADPL